ncbi:MAG: hypothetical protein QXV28_08715 [Ignisphaera sp.]
MKIVLPIAVLIIVVAIVIGITFPSLVRASGTTITLTQTQTTTRTTTITVFSTFVETIVTTKTLSIEAGSQCKNSITEIYTGVYGDEDFGLCIAKVGNKVFLLYLADAPKPWSRGYRDKTDIDFIGVGAIEIIF